MERSPAEAPIRIALALAASIFGAASCDRRAQEPPAPVAAPEAPAVAAKDPAPAAKPAEDRKPAKPEAQIPVGLQVGQRAPDFEAKDVDGVSFKLSDYRGKIVVLDFWGFW